MAKILFLVTEDWYFLSHRLSLALATQAAGAQVFVMTRIMQAGERLAGLPLEIIPWQHIRRGSVNPAREALALQEVWSAYRRIRPDLVHHVAVKPAVYGGLAARLAGVPAMVTTFAGMGAVFTGDSPKIRLVRNIVSPLMRAALNSRNSRTIVQNNQIRERLGKLGIVPPEQTVLIRGSGVNPEDFSSLPEPVGTPVVMQIGRAHV